MFKLKLLRFVIIDVYFANQTDNHFNKKSNKFMDHMELNVFKRKIDKLIYPIQENLLH